jgi:hypothetical protein
MYCLKASAWLSKRLATNVHLFVIATFFAWHNHSQGPCYSPLKLTTNSNINLIGVIILFLSYVPPPATMDAVSATIVAGGQARFQ